MELFDALVLGGGGAGLFCAARLGAGGKTVAVLDHAPSFGRKILISGGGRCNFTNLHSGPERFQSSNPHFCRSALARFSSKEFVALVEKHGIDYYEKKDGQLFCSDSAKQILAMLLAECEAAKVAARPGCEIRAVRLSQEPGRSFEVETSRGTFRSQHLVVATGGISIPKIGATGFGYEIARQFGHALVPSEPALVPFVMDAAWQRRFEDLAGVAVDVSVRVEKKTFREAMLFTHRGISGPAILQASLYWKPGEKIEIDFLPDLELEAWARELRATHPEKSLAGALSLVVPKRLASALARPHGVEQPLRTHSPEELLSKFNALRRVVAIPAGTEGFEKAEVTRGGVDTEGLSSKTMESKMVPGLYFIGEVVDVTGELGGHNFQWAWASGAAAAQAIVGESTNRV